MRLSEFKAWFEGFTENIETAPSAKQWDRIREQVAKIDGTPVTREVFVDRWLPSYPAPRIPTNIGVWPYNTCLAGAVSDNKTYEVPQRGGASAQPMFDSHVAMRDLGRAEAAVA